MVYILRSSSGFFVLGSNPGPVLSGQPCSMAVKFLKRKFLLNLSPRVEDHINKMEEDLRELNDEAEIVKENIKFLMTKKVKTLGKIEKLKVKGDSKDIMENLFNRSCGKKISMLHKSGKKTWKLLQVITKKSNIETIPFLSVRKIWLFYRKRLRTTGTG